MELKDLLNNRLVTPNIETSGAVPGFGIVIRSCEKDNCCDIKYRDKKNRAKTKNNVPVKIGPGEQWFPSEGSIVELSIYEDEVIIVGETMTDYATQGKPKTMTKLDTYMDDGDQTTGGYIL